MAEKLRLVKGTSYAYFAYNIGQSAKLDTIEQLIQDPKSRQSLQQRRRAKKYFEFQPHPIRIDKKIDPIQLNTFMTHPEIDITIFDFGAISVSYQFDLPASDDFTAAIELSRQLHESPALLEHSRKEVESLVGILEKAIIKPRIDEMVETYSVFQIQEHDPNLPVAELFSRHRSDIARLLRSETGRLSEEEMQDATELRISYGEDDMAVIDWDAALLFDRTGDDIRAVLEFVNVELLELRYLDGELDIALEESYEMLSKWPRRSIVPGNSRDAMRRIGMFQVDNAILFEGVNNALKLLSDQFLARVYRLASRRFHLTDWDDSILRKLKSLESIYQKFSDYESTRRVEVLEWIIIILIAISIVIPFIPGMPKH